MRGKYLLHDKKYIQNIIDEMTICEKQRVISCDFDQLWKQLWGDTIGIQYRGEENISRDKFVKLRDGISDGINNYTLESLINGSSTSWVEPEWGFPKGRRNYKEKDIACALREFEEETGYSSNDLILVQNLMPFEEVFTGSNNKSYKHCYYLAQMSIYSDAENVFQETEVSAIAWVTYDEAKNKIRSYNLEKIEILTRVNTVLREYRIYV
jgi:8-oxo-dGTP pyrophosphatase MutT (NUDIX family)